jgi:hypothetical protein
MFVTDIQFRGSILPDQHHGQFRRTMAFSQVLMNAFF